MSKLTTIDLRDYRQPVVTSLGIILGFLLGFLGQWVTEETFSLKEAGDVLTFLGSIAGTFLLLIALFRMLSPREPSEAALAAHLPEHPVTPILGLKKAILGKKIPCCGIKSE